MGRHGARVVASDGLANDNPSTDKRPLADEVITKKTAAMLYHTVKFLIMVKLTFARGAALE